MRAPKDLEQYRAVARGQGPAAVLRAEVQKLYLQFHVKDLYTRADPTWLWTVLLRYRCRSSAVSNEERGNAHDGDDDVPSETEELRIDYPGFRQMAYEIMFHPRNETTTTASNADRRLGGTGNPASASTETATSSSSRASAAAATDAAARTTDVDRTSWRRELFFEHPFLSPAVFLQFERDERGTIAAVPLYAYIAKRMLLFQLRIQLELCATVTPTSLLPQHAPRGSTSPSSASPRCAPSLHSPLSNGLCSDDLEVFLAALIPNLRLVRDMPPWMMPYYLCHATSKFFFLCDHRHSGAISIETLMQSEVFSELLRLYEVEVQDAVVAFPVGCRVELPRRRYVDVALVDDAGRPATSSGGGATGGPCRVDQGEERHRRAASEGDLDDEEEPLASGVVVSFEGSGTNLGDMYVVRVDIPGKEQEAGVVEREGGGDEQSRASADVTLTVRVPRSHLYWCPASNESLPPDATCLDNWFSLPLMHRVYLHFTQLDVDSDGVLSEQELRRYSNSSYTPLALHRVFECYVPRGASAPPPPAERSGLSTADERNGAEPEAREETSDTLTPSMPHPVADAPTEAAYMDFKSYLTFVVATEHPQSVASAKYLWRLLDIDDTRRYIEMNVLRCFTTEIARMLTDAGLVSESHPISGQSILAEIVDIINPKWHEYVTLEDVLSCGQHAVVLLVLLNYRSFFAYDTREQVAAGAVDEFVS